MTLYLLSLFLTKVYFHFSSMLDGYYYPDLDSIRLEPEDFTDQFLFNTSLNTYGSGFIQVGIPVYISTLAERSKFQLHLSQLHGQLYIQEK